MFGRVQAAVGPRNASRSSEALTALAAATLVLSGLACASSTDGTSTAESAVTAKSKTVIRWGTIADNPQEEQDKLDEWGNFLEYMTDNLRDHGVEKVELVFCHSPAEMAEWIAAGKVDLFDESPFAAYIVHKIGDADEPFLNRWKNGNEKFGSVIFTKADGGLKSLDDLVGKMMVFRGDTSTANYFRPKVHLAGLGYKLVEKKKATDSVEPGTVGYYFVWASRDREVEEVIDGRAVAGGISDEFIDQLLGNDVGPAGSARHPRKGGKIKREDVRVLARSKPVLRRLVTVRKALDPKLKGLVKDLLLGMDKDARGKEVLATFGPSTQFSVADTPEVAYQGILDQGELLEQEIRKFSVKAP